MNRHDFDGLSLLFGAVFAIVGVMALASPQAPFAWIDVRWVPPLVAVAAGLWLLSTTRRRRSGDADEAEPERG